MFLSLSANSVLPWNQQPGTLFSKLKFGGEELKTSGLHGKWLSGKVNPIPNPGNSFTMDKGILRILSKLFFKVMFVIQCHSFNCKRQIRGLLVLLGIDTQRYPDALKYLHTQNQLGNYFVISKGQSSLRIFVNFNNEIVEMNRPLRV